MFLKNQTKQTIERSRRALERQIEANGVKLFWSEIQYESDGMNGKRMVGEKRRHVKGIIVTASGRQGSNMNMTDSGRKNAGTHTLTILYDKCIKPEYLTEFCTEDNKQYRVVSVENVDNLDLYYSITLIYTENRMEGYEHVSGRDEIYD